MQTALYVHLNAVYWPLLFCNGPLFYVYLKSQLSPQKKNIFRHWIPALAVFIFWLPYYVLPAAQKAFFFSSNSKLLPIYWIGRQALNVLLILQLFFMCS